MSSGLKAGRVICSSTFSILVFHAIASGQFPCITEPCGDSAYASCDDDNPCTIDTCVRVGDCRFECVHESTPNGSPCTDGDTCTEPDGCYGGYCVGLMCAGPCCNGHCCKIGEECCNDVCCPFEDCCDQTCLNASALRSKMIDDDDGLPHWPKVQAQMVEKAIGLADAAFLVNVEFLDRHRITDNRVKAAARLVAVRSIWGRLPFATLELPPRTFPQDWYKTNPWDLEVPSRPIILLSCGKGDNLKILHVINAEGMDELPPIEHLKVIREWEREDNTSSFRKRLIEAVDDPQSSQLLWSYALRRLYFLAQDTGDRFDRKTLFSFEQRERMLARIRQCARNPIHSTHRTAPDDCLRVNAAVEFLFGEPALFGNDTYQPIGSVEQAIRMGDAAFSGTFEWYDVKYPNENGIEAWGRIYPRESIWGRFPAHPLYVGCQYFLRFGGSRVGTVWDGVMPVRGGARIPVLLFSRGTASDLEILFVIAPVGTTPTPTIQDLLIIQDFESHADADEFRERLIQTVFNPHSSEFLWKYALRRLYRELENGSDRR